MGISSDVIRGYNDTIILYLLLDEDSYGYEISKRIREISGGKYIIKETTLYSAFSRLEKNGYIVSYPGAETNGRKRTYYRITSAGRAYYFEKCREWYLTKDVIEHFIMRGLQEETDELTRLSGGGHEQSSRQEQSGRYEQSDGRHEQGGRYEQSSGGQKYSSSGQKQNSAAQKGDA